MGNRFRRVGLTWEITIGTVTAPHLYTYIYITWKSDAMCGAQLVTIGTVTAYFAHPLMQVPTTAN